MMLRWWLVCVWILFTTFAANVRADIAPEPERPVDWDEHPSPMPQEPPEEALARRLAPLVALGLSGLTLAFMAKRARTNRRRAT